MLSRFLLATSLICTCVGAQAQNGYFIDIANRSDAPKVLGAGGYAYRVGKAVAYWVHRKNELGSGFGYSVLGLLACDGSWYVPSVQFVQPDDQTSSFQVFQDAAAGVEGEVDFALAPMKFSVVSGSNDEQIRRVSPLRKRLCKEAMAEPRNMLFPVAKTYGEGQNSSFVVSIVTGTSELKGSIVTLWLKYSNFVEKPLLDKNGNNIVVDGKGLMDEVSSKSFSLSRSQIDCGKGRYRVVRLVSYSEDGTPVGSGEAENKFDLIEPVPGSVAEGVIDGVCKVYAP